MSEISKLITEIKSEGILRAGNKLEQLYSLAEQMETDYAALQQKLDALADKLARSEDYSVGVDAERMEYIKKCNALAAENAALKSGAKYFMYGPDCGFEHYNSQDEALKAANEMIGDYREDAADGWCDEVDQVCFGIVLSYSLQHDVKPPSEDNGFLGSVDYIMKAPETPATDVYLNSLRAEGAIAVRNALLLADDGSDIYAIATETAEQLRSGTHDTADKAG